MASYIRRSFEDDILKNLDWMDDNVKERARKKLKLMDEFIAYSEEYLDKEKIDEMHKGILPVKPINPFFDGEKSFN